MCCPETPFRILGMKLSQILFVAVWKALTAQTIFKRLVVFINRVALHRNIACEGIAFAAGFIAYVVPFVSETSSKIVTSSFKLT